MKSLAPPRQCAECATWFRPEAAQANRGKGIYCSRPCSDIGRGRAMRYTAEEEIEAFWSRVDKSAGPSGCWLWTGGLGKAGYGYARRHRKHIYAHRLSFELAHGFQPEKSLNVCHRCDVRACVNPAHLFLGTHQDNMDDAKAKNRFRCRNKKLTPEVLSVIQSSDKPVAVLSEELNVHRTTVWKAKRILAKAATGGAASQIRRLT